MPSSTYADMEDHRALHLALELSLLGYNEGSEHHASEPLSVYDEIRLKKSQNMTECVPVPSSEHVAEIVGRQGCKIKALRAKTNTYIKTPVRGEEPVFVVTGRREDVAAAKREILSAAEHFSQIRASRRNSIVNGVAGAGLVPPTPIPGQTTIQVRVPYRVVGLVVGPKGATIKRIQQQTHTYIVTPSRDKEPIFEVTGLPENVEQAKKEIEGHIALRTGLSSGLNDEAELHLNLALSGLNGLGGLDPQLLMGLGTSELMSSLYKTQRNAQATPANNNPASGPPPDPLGLLSNLNALNSLADFSYLDHHHATPVGGAPFTSDSPASKLDLGFGAGGLGGFGALYEPDEGIGLSGSDSPTFGSALLPPSNIWSADYGKFSAASLASKRSSPGGGGFGLDSMDNLLRSAGDHAHLPARRTSSDPLASINSTLASFGLGGLHHHHHLDSDPCSRDSQSPAGDSTGSAALDSPLEGGTASPTSSGSSSRGSLKRECVQCCDAEVVAALVPCGHNLFCMDCAKRIVEAGPDAPGNECPVCHQAVSQAIRIFSQ